MVSQTHTTYTTTTHPLIIIVIAPVCLSPPGVTILVTATIVIVIIFVPISSRISAVPTRGSATFFFLPRRRITITVRFAERFLSHDTPDVSRLFVLRVFPRVPVRGLWCVLLLVDGREAAVRRSLFRHGVHRLLHHRLLHHLLLRHHVLHLLLRGVTHRLHHGSLHHLHGRLGGRVPRGAMTNVVGVSVIPTCSGIIAP
jgi:hypothetical protein